MAPRRRDPGLGSPAPPVVGARRHRVGRSCDPSGALRCNKASAVGGGLVSRQNESASAGADAEDLAATERAGALDRGLAVLHRDLLGVLDFDLLLVLDAISLGHAGLL